MTEQKAKAEAFRAYHARETPLLLPNPWDAGSARFFEDIGFEAQASTSLGAMGTRGRMPATAELVLDNLREVCAATDLPVNADLENCFADAPEAAANIFPRAAEAGAVGGSIEDATGNREAPIYDFSLAVERVAAAAEAVRALPIPFTLTARAEGLLYKSGDIDEIIHRLQAFETAGADCLYAPGLRSLGEMKTVIDAVGKPVNVVMGFADPDITLTQLAEIGVRRISIGGAIYRVAMKAALAAAAEMRDGGFTFVRDTLDAREIRRVLA